MISSLPPREQLRTDRALGVDFIPRVVAGALSTSDAAPPVPPVEPIAPERIEQPSAPATTTRAQAIAERGRVFQGDRAAQLEALREHHAATCPHCTHATGHTNLVFGEGDPEAELMFVGEAPGETEDQTGRPFVGKAGQKLDEMIAAMGLRRDQIYIANVLKARPPNNRTPLPDEVLACGPTLMRQISIIRPRVIVTLGSPATKFLLARDEGITRLRGVWATCSIPEEFGGGEVQVMPTFHPAYLLRNYTPETRKAVWSDLCQVVERLALPRSGA